MKDVTREEWARRLLEDQLGRLGELRNANPRDGGFKLWRQTTLTVIQRIWPTDLAKSERFRRISFTTPSPKATTTQVKEFYARGCVEASSTLRALMMELEGAGIPPAAPTRATPEASAPSAEEIPAHERRDFFEPSPLGTRTVPAPEDDETGPSIPVIGPKREPVLDETDELETFHPRVAPPNPRREPAAPPPAPPPAPREPAAPSASEVPPAPRPSPPQQGQRPRPLKEMLGFAEETARQQPPPPRSAASRPAPVARAAPEPQPSPAEPTSPPPFAEIEPDEVSVPGAPFPFVEPAPSIDADREGSYGRDEEEPDLDPQTMDDEEEEIQIEMPSFDEEEDDEDEAIRFLEASPVFNPGAKSAARPVTAPSPSPSRAPAPLARAAGRSPAVMALTALAGEVAAMGVSRSRRAAVRAALLDLAEELQRQEPTWGSVRELIQLTLDHPSLARRVIPLLVPFLDLER